MATKGNMCYRIPKGTSVWLLIDGNEGHMPMTTEKDVVYTEKDRRPDIDDTEYRFMLPPNDRQVRELLVLKERVRVAESFSQLYPPPYRR